MKKFSKEIQIALVAVVGIIVLYFGLQFLKGMTLFSTDNRYFVKFQDVSGLSVASPIFANGYRVPGRKRSFGGQSYLCQWLSRGCS